VELDVHLTAALGKRTKYQQTAHAQMYVYAKSHVSKALEHIDIKKDTKFSEKAADEVDKGMSSNSDGGAGGDGTADEVKSIPRPQSEGGFQHGVFEVGRRVVVEGNSKSGEEAAIREVKLDDTDGGPEENILLEGGPKYIDEVDKGGELHAIDMAVLLALCLDVSNSNPAVCYVYFCLHLHLNVTVDRYSLSDNRLIDLLVYYSLCIYMSRMA
jgi:hypothetical protein